MSPFGLFSADEKREESVEFQDFEDWFLKEVRDSEFGWSDVDEVYCKVEQKTESLERALNEFMGEDLSEEIAPRLKNMAESNRKVLISRLQSFLDSFEVPEEEDYRALKEFLEERSSELDEVSEKIKKSLMVLDKAQPDVTKRVVDGMKGLERVLEVDEDLVEATEVINRILSLETKVERLSKLEDKKAEVEEELNGLLKEREKLEEDLKELEEKEKTEVIEKKERRIEEVKGKISEKEDRIRGGVSPLKRGLKKMKYFGLSGGDENLLEKYISSPVEAVKEDEDMSFLESITEDMKDKLREEELDFSEDEASRLREEVENIDLQNLKQSLDSLQDLRERREDLESSVRELRMDRKKEDLSGSVARKEDEIENVRERLDKREDEIEKLWEEIEEFKEEVEKSVEDLLDVKLELKGIEP